MQKKKEGTAETVSLLLIKNREYHEKSKKNASKKLMKFQGKQHVKRHPTLEDGVYIGCGAKCLGNITLKKGCRVGANAVVLKDVPEGATAVGIPARIIEKK